MACLRDSSDDGLCPVKDTAPKLWPSNELVIQIFDQVEGSGHQVETKNKTLIYIRPNDVLSVMDINGIPQEDRPHLYVKIMHLQDIVNYQRQPYKKK